MADPRPQPPGDLDGLQLLARHCLRTEFDHPRTAEFVERELLELPPIMARVLCLRFGIGEDSRSADEICSELGVNKYRLKDLETVGIRKIRKAARL